MFVELTPAEDGIGAQGIEPRDDFGAKARFPLGQWRPEGAARLDGVAAMLNGFIDVTYCAKCVGNAREQRHVDSSCLDSPQGAAHGRGHDLPAKLLARSAG